MNDYFDVWLAFGSDNSEEAEYEANTRMTDTGYAVDYYHTAVGMVSTKEFDTLADAYDWLESEAFENYTS